MLRVHHHRAILRSSARLSQSLGPHPSCRVRTLTTITPLPSAPPTPGAPEPRGSARLLLYGAGAFALGLGAYVFQPTTYRGAPTIASEPISPAHFTPAKVVSNRPAGVDSVLLEVELPPGTAPSSAPGPIWSVCVKDDDIQVERAYTPLVGEEVSVGKLRFWVRKYKHGEVGRWVCSRKVGDVLPLRGPMPTLPWDAEEFANKYDDVILISGGTGITPFYQLLHQTFLSQQTATNTPPTPYPRFTLLHGSRAPAELPPEEILGPLRAHATAHPDTLRVQLFVDALDGRIESQQRAENNSLTLGRVTRDVVRGALRQGTSGNAAGSRSWWPWSSSVKSDLPLTLNEAERARRERTLVLVCGPEAMIAAVAGPYGRNYSQGPIGGILAELGFTSSQVRKL